MLYHAHNGSVRVGNSEMDYISFGSGSYLKKYRRLYPLLGKIGKPKSFKRFLIQAASCIRHNAYDELNKIICPTLVIGGDCDKIAGTASASEIADKISGSELFIYHGLGHAAYEEAKDFNERVLNSVNSKKSF